MVGSIGMALISKICFNKLTEIASTIYMYARALVMK
jgi:hypothetical protein